jgi:uncharacterized protein (UPF0264 family)
MMPTLSNILCASVPPRLLVSVRNAFEAVTALEAGADVIDVKEPDRGALGAADFDTIAAVVAAIDGRAPVTAALGELAEVRADSFRKSLSALPAGVSLFKFGLAGCGEMQQWQTLWETAIAGIQTSATGLAAQPVAVVYADWRAARAPAPNLVLDAAVAAAAPVLLVDTFNKTAGNLFDHWPVDDLRDFISRVHEANLAIVLAGSLTGRAFADAVALGANLVAVRGAACEAGRQGNVSPDRVQSLKQAITHINCANYDTTPVVAAAQHQKF